MKAIATADRNDMKALREKLNKSDESTKGINLIKVG
jgi:hypothetical protein